MVYNSCQFNIKAPQNTQPSLELPMDIQAEPQYTNDMHHAAAPVVREVDGSSISPSSEWSSGLCQIGNHSLGLCCCAIWCPCVVFAEINQRLQKPPYETSVFDCSGEGFHSACLSFALMNCLCVPNIFDVTELLTGAFIMPCGCLLHRVTRRNVRELYNIKPSCCGDTVDTIMCSCCALMQEHGQIYNDRKGFTM